MSFKKFSATEYNEALAMNEVFDAPEVSTTDFVGELNAMSMTDTTVIDADVENAVLSAEDDAAIAELDADAIIDAGLGNVDVPVLTTEAPQGSFLEQIGAITDEAAIVMAIEVGKAIDERADFERAKGNDNIQKALAKSRKQLATPSAARVLIACSVDPSMINRSVHEGVRYNVYALGKLADAINGLTNGSVNNAINIACMKSLFRFKAAGKDFTGEMAKAAASDKIRVDTGLKGMLVRHTVSASTSSTQASSTMQALTTLGIVERSGSHKNPTFTLSNTAVVDRLRSVLGEAAPEVTEEAIAA